MGTRRSSRRGFGGVHHADRLPPKANQPPGDDALIELAELHGHAETHAAPVVSLTDYAALAEVAY
jgi:hypothetical protein